MKNNSIIRFPYDMMFQLGPGNNDLFPFTNGLEVWLDSSDTSTIIKNGSNAVSQQSDKSGNNNHATQSTESSRATYVSDHVDGLSVIEYNGTDEQMILSTINLTGEYTIFWVANSQDTASTAMLLGTTGASNKLGHTSGGKMFVRSVDAGSSDATIDHPTQDQTYIGVLKRDASNKVDLGFDGGTYNRLFSDAAQSGTMGLTRLGIDESGNRWDGDIGEIIIFSRALSDAERLEMEIFLANKWGIYHPSATWIKEYPTIAQTAINAGELTRPTVKAQQPNLYVMIGHSNMVGYSASTFGNAFPHLRTTVSGVKIWNYTTGESGSWDTIEAGVNNKSTNANTMGPEMNLAYFLNGLNSETQYIVKSAAASAHMANDSDAATSYYPTYGDLYDDLRDRITGAAETLAATGVIPKLAGYFVFLGGNDRSAGRSVAVEDNLNLLLDTTLSADDTLGLWGDPDIFVTSLVDYDSPSGTEATVEAGLDAVVAARTNATKLDVTGIAIGPDGSHFDYNGQTDVGEIYAEQYVTITMPYSGSRVLALDANEDLSTITKDGSDLVSSWTDGTEDGTAAGADRPTWVDAQLNGKPVIRFTGSEFLNFGASSPLSFTGQTDCLTVIAVIDNAVSGTILGKAQSTGSGRQWQMFVNASRLQIFIGGSTTDFTDIPANSTARMLTMTSNLSANTVRGYSGSTESSVVTGDPGSATDSADVLMGARRSTDSNTGTAFLFSGDLAETLAYTGQMTVRMIGKMEAYIEGKWGSMT